MSDDEAWLLQRSGKVSNKELVHTVDVKALKDKHRRSLDALQMDYQKQTDQTATLIRERKAALHDLESLRSEIRSLKAANASLLRRNTDLRRRLDTSLKQNGELKDMQLKREKSMLQIASSLATAHKSLHRELTHSTEPTRSSTPVATAARSPPARVLRRLPQTLPVSMPPSPASSIASNESEASSTPTPRETASPILPSFGTAIALMQNVDSQLDSQHNAISTTPLNSPPKPNGRVKRLAASLTASGLPSVFARPLPAVPRTPTLRHTGTIRMDPVVGDKASGDGSRGTHDRVRSASLLDDMLNFPTVSELATTQHEQDGPPVNHRRRTSSQMSQLVSQRFLVQAALRRAGEHGTAEPTASGLVSHELVPLSRFHPSASSATYSYSMIHASVPDSQSLPRSSVPAARSEACPDETRHGRGCSA